MNNIKLQKNYVELNMLKENSYSSSALIFSNTFINDLNSTSSICIKKGHEVKKYKENNIFKEEKNRFFELEIIEDKVKTKYRIGENSIVYKKIEIEIYKLIEDNNQYTEKNIIIKRKNEETDVERHILNYYKEKFPDYYADIMTYRQKEENERDSIMEKMKQSYLMIKKIVENN